jgi:hypothetical protein
MQPTETAQQDVLGGPPSGSTQLTQVCADVVISLVSQHFEVDVVFFNRAGKREKRPDLLPLDPIA